MTARAEIERSIADEEAILDRVVGLLESATALETWPERLRTALGLALAEDASRAEAWKVVTLRRHLFGGGATPRLPIPGTASTVDRRLAERLRSDLPGRVRFRAGAYLA